MKNINQHRDKLTLHDVVDAMTSGFTRLENYIDARANDLAIEIREVQQQLGRFELRFEDMSDTVLNHEERLVKLERPHKLNVTS